MQIKCCLIKRAINENVFFSDLYHMRYISGVRVMDLAFKLSTVHINVPG